MRKNKSTPIKRRSQSAEIWHRILKNKAAVIGLIILFIFAFVAVFADLIVPYDLCIKINGEMRLQPPSAEHFFGTDNLGRDVFARIVHGSRISLTIGLVTTLISVVIGGFLGAAAGYYGGKADNIIMRLVDVFMCIPSILLALAIVAALGPGLRNLLIAITFSYVPVFTRMVRAVILNVVDQDYVEAARAYGAKDSRIILRYIVPNAMGPIIVQCTMGIAGMILSAASLSYIGMGIQPPAPEWGAMLSDAREFMRTAPYLIYFAGFSILFAALAFNLVGDGLRDALDPKLKD